MVHLLSQGREDVQAFYSSDPKTGVMAGEGIMARINHEISRSDYFLPIITENYVRSIYCMYELSIAAYLQGQKKIKLIPIVANRSIYDRVNAILSQPDILYIDARMEKAPQVFFQAFDWVSSREESLVKEILSELSEQTSSHRNYIGMDRDTYSNILEYCQKYGIKQIKSTTLPSDILKAKVIAAKEVVLLSTTGASLIKSLCTDAFPEALAKGCKISVLLPNQHSDFCRDVAEIERPEESEENMLRLVQEFSDAMGYLKDALHTAKSRAQGEVKGSIDCFCSHNLLRQTVLLVKNQDDTLWAWVSLTMPPKRTIDGTPSMEVEGKLEEGSLAYLLWNHCRSIISVSRRRGSCFSMDGNKKGPFFFETSHAKEYWTEKYKIASENMEQRKDQYECALIEVAAQHPLKKKKLPGEEFKRRLDAAISIYEELTDSGIEAMFYIPGSRHRHNGVDDLVSLSSAGREYLIGKGIDPQLIYGDDMNDKYKGAAGVYNSADECYVASKIFMDGEFDRLICVCSPFQIFRKTLFYYEFGVVPHCYGIPAEKMYHSVLNELFENLNSVIYNDHSWQDPAGEAFNHFRRERMPQASTE